jgi:hypothetical protein
MAMPQLADIQTSWPCQSSRARCTSVNRHANDPEQSSSLESGARVTYHADFAHAIAPFLKHS